MKGDPGTMQESPKKKGDPDMMLESRKKDKEPEHDARESAKR